MWKPSAVVVAGAVAVSGAAHGQAAMCAPDDKIIAMLAAARLDQPKATQTAIVNLVYAVLGGKSAASWQKLHLYALLDFADRDLSGGVDGVVARYSAFCRSVGPLQPTGPD